MGFEIYAKRGIKNIYYHYFLFFVILSKRFKQKLIIPIESCFLDGKKPNIAISICKNSSLKRLFSTNPMKVYLLGYFCISSQKE